MNTSPPLFAVSTDSSYMIACFFALLFFIALCKAALWLSAISAEMLACFHESEKDAAFEDCACSAEAPEAPQATQSPVQNAINHPDALAARDRFLGSHGFDPLPTDTRPTVAGGVTSHLR